MNRPHVLRNLLIATLLGLFPPVPGQAPAAAPAPAPIHLDPDHVLARVGPRVIRAADFSRMFFESDPETRPRPDSAGRVEFLETMVKRDLFSLVALEVNPPLDFAARVRLREFTKSVLKNVLYLRMVADSVTVTEQEILEAYDQYKYDVRLEHIQVQNRLAAERIRQDLKAKRISWEDAVTGFSMADRERSGDLGWRNRIELDPTLAQAIFGLAKGEVSEVVGDNRGYHVFRVAERRPGKPVALGPIRGAIANQIRSHKQGILTRRIQERLLADYSVSYDAENLAWTARQFRRPIRMTRDENNIPVVTIDETTPEIAPQDTSRILARFPGRDISVGQLLSTYEAMEPVFRPALDTPEAVQGQADVMFLDPRMLEIAQQRGLDRDSSAVAAIESRREAMLVERLFADSIEARVRITDEMLRGYYRDHQAAFVTYPRVRFASFFRGSRAGADSLAASLRAGASAEHLLRADSLEGMVRGAIQERSQNEAGPFHRILFEEMRPNQVLVDGPDKKGDFLILQLLSFDPGRQLSYQEALPIAEEAVRRAEEDRLFEEFLKRYARRFQIERHPELVMRILLSAQ